MWPFRKKNDLIDLFGKQVSAEAITKFLKEAEENKGGYRLKEQQTTYIIIHVRDDDVARLIETVPQIIEIVEECDGLIVTMMCSIILAAFDLPLTTQEAENIEAQERATDRRKLIIERMLGEFPSDVRIVSTQKKGSYGFIGGRQYVEYGVLVPEFSEQVGALLRLPFGTCLDY